MRVVVDASVALKWFFRIRDDEENVEQAVQILKAIGSGQLKMLQPPHFLAEMGAVLAREKPESAQTDLTDLMAIDSEVFEDPSVYMTAVDLASRLQQHLFDTLYQATALHVADATLVTADRRYYSKAKNFGSIRLLADFRLKAG